VEIKKAAKRFAAFSLKKTNEKKQKVRQTSQRICKPCTTLQMPKKLRRG